MTPNRCEEKIKSIFQEALDHPLAERTAFVSHKCSGDALVLERVLHLLDQHNQAEKSTSLGANQSSRSSKAQPSVSVEDTRPPSQLSAEIAFSRGQGVDSDQTFDFQNVTHPKLLCGGWITFAFFLSYSVRIWLANAPVNLLGKLVHCAAIGGMIWALGCSLILHLKRCSVKELNFLVYSLLIVTTLFLISYQVKELRVYQLRVSASDEQLVAELEQTAHSVVLPFFAVIVAYGIFVPDPRKRLTGEVEKFRDQLQRFFVPDRSRHLAWALHALALWPLLITLGFAVLNGMFSKFTSPLVEMAIWLSLGRCIAHYGPYQFDQLDSTALERAKQGRYVLSEKLGSGGMGDVFLAEDRFVNRWCAYKTIRRELVDDARALDRFKREAWETARLCHPSIVGIYDFGQAKDGTFYYVMEYVHGLCLQDVVHLHGPLPPWRVVHLLRQICLALRRAHEMGVIHRDIKPANIMISQPSGMDEVVKVLDFGLVRNVDASNTRGLTGVGEILGTPEYMPPEQAMGTGDVDKRSDIYCLGGVAYYLLTGFPPFGEKKGGAAIQAHAQDSVVRPSYHQPAIPCDLEAVILKCLEKKPHERHMDAKSMERSLAACKCASYWDETAMAEWWKQHPVPDLPSELPISY